jgi:RNA methyltransferase, TrmH family
MMISKSKIKYIQSLYQKKKQEEEGRFIAEGPKIINELLAQHPDWVEEVFCLPDLLPVPAAMSHVLTIITPEELERISALQAPAGAIAILKMPQWPPLQFANRGWTLALEDIRDPGNLGTLVRIADWFGVEQIVCSPSCAFIYNPKVIQASMGSFARVPVYYTSLEDYLQQAGMDKVYAAVLQGTDVRTIEKPAGGVLLIGNESRGISAELLQLEPHTISIVSQGQAESLNAAVAAGILLSHLV